MNRRQALKQLTVLAAAAPISSSWLQAASHSKPWLELAVQQYSFNRQLRAGSLDLLDFPKTVVEGTGIKALEYFNGHMEDKVGKNSYFKEIRKRTDDLGATNIMMLLRSKPALDSPASVIRAAAVEGYRPWMEAMHILGGKHVRVDVRSPGNAKTQKQHAIDGLRALSTVADKEFDGMNILVENHGNHSGNGKWVAEVMKAVNLDNCGTLPDFQNFKDYDPYLGVEEMMPWAKVICAKAKDFDTAGNETNVDFRRMLKIVKAAGFRGYIGIEFEGHGMDPVKGINATKRLIKKIMEELG